MKFPDNYFIIIDGVYATVLGDAYEVFENGKLEKDMAYTNDGHCFIYGGKLKDKVENGYFYKNGEKLVFVPAHDSETNKVEYIKNTTLIKREMCDKSSIKEQVESIDTADLRIFAPVIKDTDDPLKRIVKLMLQDLQIDMREYSSKFDKEYDLTNLKASVTKEAPMSMRYFLRWCEVLDVECTMNIKTRSKHSKHSLSKDIKLIIE